MRLLRLVSGKNDMISEWTNYWNNDFIIKKNSKIALKSISIKYDNSECFIDNTNNQFNFTIGNNDFLVSIEKKSYTPENLVYTLNLAMYKSFPYEFKDEIQTEPNTQLFNNCLGFFPYFFLENNKINLTYWFNNISSLDLTKSIVSNIEEVDGVLKSTSPQINNSWILNKTPLLTSFGVFRYKVYEASSFNLSLLEVRTMQELAIGNDFDFNNSYFTAGTIHSEEMDETKYFFNFDNNPFKNIDVNEEPDLVDYVDSMTIIKNVDIDENDYINIFLRGNDIIFLIVDSLGITKYQKTLTSNYFKFPIQPTIDNLYPLFQIRSDDSFNIPEMIFDPRYTNNDNIITFNNYSNEIHNNNLLKSNIKVPNPSLPLNFKLTFITFLNNVLGFKSKILNYTGLSHTFVSDEDINYLLNDNSIIVEIPSLTLQTIDTTTFQRRNIIAIIPNLQNLTGSLKYESNNPIFIDINNRDDINIRNMTTKVLFANSEGDTTFNITLPVEVVLLVDD